MPNAFALHESTLLGLQSSIGLALTHSLDLQNKQDALVRNSYHPLQRVAFNVVHRIMQLLSNMYQSAVLHRMDVGP